MWLPAGPQYQSYHLLLAEVSSFSARLPYAGYRPRLRPAGAQLFGPSCDVLAGFLLWLLQLSCGRGSCARFRSSGMPSYALLA